MKYKIYTKTGDDGTSGLVGGNRVKKSDLRLEAYGTVDELNSWIGLIRASSGNNEVSELLMDVQNNLFIIGSKLASDEQGKPITDCLVIDSDKIEKLENAIDTYEVNLPVIHNFILPGGSVLPDIAILPERSAGGLNDLLSGWMKIQSWIKGLCSILTDCRIISLSWPGKSRMTVV